MRPGYGWLLLPAILIALSIPVDARSKSHGGHPWNYCYSCPRDSHGRIKRSSSARQSFLKSKGMKRTPPGCQVDHVVPLAKGGEDTPANMQLLCDDELKAKERSELK